VTQGKTVLANSAILAVMTALSRVCGLAREMLIASLLGTSRWADIWNFSFMLPNMFRRFFAEGALSSALVPLLAEVHGTPAEERKFASAFFSLVLLAATIFSSLFILLAPHLLPALEVLRAPGSAGSGEDLQLAVLPTQLLFPFLVFVSLAAVCQGILNIHNRFALAAAAPIVLNFAIIFFGWLLGSEFDNPLWSLCIGVLIGGFLQWFVQWVGLHRLGLAPKLTRQLWGSRTREALLLWAPMTLGAGVYQVNLLVSQSIAFSLSPSALSSLNYSNRLIELVLGVFATSVSTSILPQLAKDRSAGLATFGSTLYESLEGIALITLPASLGLMVAGEPILALLFQRGAFDESSLRSTCLALLFHAMGLLPLAWYRISSQAFFAMKMVRLVLGLSFLATVLNLGFCFWLPTLFPAGAQHAGIALATTCYAWILAILAQWLVSRMWGITPPKGFSGELLRMALASCAILVPFYLLPTHPGGPFGLLCRIALAVTAYVIALKAFKVRGLRNLERILRRALAKFPYLSRHFQR